MFKIRSSQNETTQRRPKTTLLQQSPNLLFISTTSATTVSKLGTWNSDFQRRIQLRSLQLEKQQRWRWWLLQQLLSSKLGRIRPRSKLVWRRILLPPGRGSELRRIGSEFCYSGSPGSDLLLQSGIRSSAHERRNAKDLRQSANVSLDF